MQLFWIHLEDLSKSKTVISPDAVIYYGSYFYFTVVWQMYVKWTEALITFLSLYWTVDISKNIHDRELRWESFRRTLSLPHSLHTARLPGNHFWTSRKLTWGLREQSAWLEGENVAGMRNEDMNWRREKQQCCRGERALFAEKGEREKGGGRQQCIRFMEEKHFLKTIDWEFGRSWLSKVYKQQNWKSEVLKVSTITRVKPGRHNCAPVEKKGWGLRVDSVVWGSPGLYWERQFPFLECILERWHGFWRDRRDCGCHWAALFISIPVEGAKLDASFLLQFSIKI